MNKAIVQFVESHKFILDTIYSKIPNVDIYGLNIRQNLYKNVFHIKPDYIFFSGNDLTEEIVSFLSDYTINYPKLKVYVCWKDSETFATLDNKYGVTHIIPEHHPKKITDHDTVCYPANLLNENLYYPLEPNTNKDNTIVGFLDSIKTLPKNLEPYLYPNKKLPIKLFNNPRIPTIHNLGTIAEPDKANLLRLSKYYLDINNTHVLEAKACGCIILKPEDLDNFDSIDNDENFTTINHSKFLQENIFI